MTGMPLTLACGDYDRTRRLADGSVKPDGLELNVIQLPVEEIFFRMVRFGEFHAAELSLSSYLLSLDDEAHGRFVAIPVFPSRAFRHSAIYVNADAGIERAEDLVGRTVGIPEYQVTAAVWIRGILAEYHHVPVDSVRYRTGGLHQPGRVEKIRLSLPDAVSVTPIGDTQVLSDMLAAGEIDALYSPRAPRSLMAGDGRVRRLFADPRQVEEEYFRRTSIFPIMHVVAIDRAVYQQNRWIATSLQKAFEQARVAVAAQIDDVTALRYMLPWLAEEVRSTQAIMGTDYWTYGLDPLNVNTVETLARYSHQQSLARRPYRVDEIFAPETFAAVHV
ncbi:MAG: ABC transporter substrate-binding protein [Mycobacterium sp.]